MTAAERVRLSMTGGEGDRVPTLPKIWVDFSARQQGLDLVEVIGDPKLAMECVVKTALDLGMDASRTFCFPRRRVERDGELVLEKDEEGRRLGTIDMAGGLATLHDSRSPSLIEDPSRTAFINFHKCAEPWIADRGDIERFRIPEAGWYLANGYGLLLSGLNRIADGRIALLGNCEAIALGFAASVRGLERAIFDLVDDPAFAHAVMDIGDRIAIERGKFHIDLGFRILRLNDSIANMSVISPGHWREFVFPHFRNVCAELKRYCPEAVIYSHCCGNTLPILAELHAAGVDCVGPVDPMANFDCRDARRAIGDGVSMHGGMNTLSFIDKSEEEVIEEATVCIESAGRKAFVLGSGCSVPRGAKGENIAALRTAVIRAAS